ncbi:hypothetical protein SKAU_G00025090 [Synaphobranchus kaupii]|uniref:Uncharacterized protein n=1 Tax=Synaphobranchus kaupii TaxID=118154 RepID=A0A9Q1JCL2_SYNKA|nr:hypothetical protein SKAU_G00025090 [Synaphobranchus kaupii]
MGAGGTPGALKPSLGKDGTVVSIRRCKLRKPAKGKNREASSAVMEAASPAENSCTFKNAARVWRVFVSELKKDAPSPIMRLIAIIFTAGSQQQNNKGLRNGTSPKKAPLVQDVRKPPVTEMTLQVATTYPQDPLASTLTHPGSAYLQRHSPSNPPALPHSNNIHSLRLRVKLMNAPCDDTCPERWRMHSLQGSAPSSLPDAQTEVWAGTEKRAAKSRDKDQSLESTIPTLHWQHAYP